MGANQSRSSSQVNNVNEAISSQQAELNAQLLAAVDQQAELDAQLIAAAEKGDVEKVKWLLDLDVKVDVTEEGRRTPLIVASKNGHEAVVRLLLARRAMLEETDEGERSLYVAAENGHEIIVGLLLDQGVKLEIKYVAMGWTPLYVASKNGHEAVVRLLLARGAKLGAKDRDGKTPLHVATENGHEKIVRCILDRAVELKRFGEMEFLLWTALYDASKNGHEEMVRYILDRAVELVVLKDSVTGWVPLHAAVQGGHEEVIKLLLDRGADLHERDNQGKTPLDIAKEKNFLFRNSKIIRLLENHLKKEPAQVQPEVSKSVFEANTPSVSIETTSNANIQVVSNNNSNAAILPQKQELNAQLLAAAGAGDIDRVKLLSGLGAQVKAKNESGWTSLHFAVLNGSEEVVRFLLEQGAKVTVSVKGGLTPLHIAAKGGHRVIAEILLARGAKLEAVDESGWTSMHYAALKGSEEVMVLLLGRGAKWKVATREKLTPLHIAALYEHEAVARLLLGLGSELEAVNEDKETALHMASKNGHEAVAVVRLLLDRGAKLEAVNKSKETALHIASKNGHEAVVRLLLDRGTELEVVDTNEQTPLHVAVESGRKTAVVRLLLDRGAKVQAKDRWGQTPLDRARGLNCKGSHDAIIQLLEIHLHQVVEKNDLVKEELVTEDKTESVANQVIEPSPEKNNIESEVESKEQYFSVQEQDDPLSESSVSLPMLSISSNEIDEKKLQLQKKFSLAPEEFMGNVQTKLKEKSEQLENALSAQENFKRQLAVLSRNQDNPVEIKKLKAKVDDVVSMLQPKIKLWEAQEQTLMSFAKNEKLIEFYHASFEFLKIFFKGMAGASTPVSNNKANGSLGKGASIVSKIGILVSEIPFGRAFCMLIADKLREEDEKIIAKRVRKLATLSMKPGFKLTLEKIARGLTERYEDSLNRVRNVKKVGGALEQAINSLYKKGDFTPIQELADFRVTLAVASLLSCKTIFDLEQQCLNIIISSSIITAIKEKLESFLFGSEMVYIETADSSIKEAQKCHYKEFFGRSGVRVGDQYFSNGETKHQLLGYRKGTMQEVQALKLTEELHRNQNDNNSNAITSTVSTQKITVLTSTSQEKEEEFAVEYSEMTVSVARPTFHQEMREELEELKREVTYTKLRVDDVYKRVPEKPQNMETEVSLGRYKQAFLSKDNNNFPKSDLNESNIASLHAQAKEQGVALGFIFEYFSSSNPDFDSKFKTYSQKQTASEQDQKELFESDGKTKSLK